MMIDRRSLLCLLPAFSLSVAPLVAVVARDVLSDRINRFNTVMHDFTIQLHGGVFNCREAKLLSKLWRDIEDSGNWPK